ncbi:MAG: ATP-binding protein [Chloroflexota bacterium]
MNTVPFRLNLRVRLLLTYLLVIGVGAVTVVVTTSLVAPSFYDIHMAGMTGPGGTGAGGMMGGSSGTGGTGTMMQGADAAIRAAYQQAVLQSVLAGVAVAVIVAVIIGLFVSSRIADPIKRTVTAAGRLAAGHYAERVPVPGEDRHARQEDELGQLAASFNQMASSLEQTERKRVDLLGDVAHELRTPINTLQGYLEGLLDEVIEPTPELWASMHSEAGRMQRLVNDLQDLSRAEARQLSLKVEPYETRAIIDAAVYGLRLHFAEKGVDLRVHTSPDLPQVLADRDRAVQVLTNLLGNSLRYTPAPGIVTLTASSTRSALGMHQSDKLAIAAKGGEVLFQVADTGIGIASENLPHIFERFYRVDKSRSRAAGGSGIGLTITQALVQVMGGRIWAESAGTGKGSTFCFTLPVAH